jgi:hypothetical protein
MLTVLSFAARFYGTLYIGWGCLSLSVSAADHVRAAGYPMTGAAVLCAGFVIVLMGTVAALSKVFADR